jgi:colanic acid/amylovoran biosynthesis protein
MSERSAKVLLLGATFSTGNMGVGALAASAVRVLHRKYGDGSITVLDYARQPRSERVEVDGGLATINLINMRFSWKIFLPNNIASLLFLAALCRVNFLGMRRWIVSRNRCLRAIDEARAAFAVSGGDSFSDIYGMGRFFYVTLPQVLVSWMGKPLVMMPQTIGPFEGAFPRRVAGGLIRNAARVYSRDRPGVEVARELSGNGGGNVQFKYDLGFALEPKPASSVRISGPSYEEQAGKELVGINVSGLLMMGGYNRGNMFDLKVDYPQFIDELVRYFCEMPGTAVVLVPHVFGQDPESDQRACRAVYDKHAERYRGKISCIDSEHDQHEIKHLIGRCSFFLGARMHACIAALSQGVPAVAMAYSRKFVGVLETVGAGGLVVDPRNATLDEMMRVVKEKFSERRSIAAGLQAVMPQVKRDVLGMLDDLN